jgi:hypothetical protein
MMMVIIIIINTLITLDYRTAHFNITFLQLLPLRCGCGQLSTSHCMFTFGFCETVLVVTAEESHLYLLMKGCTSRANGCTVFLPNTKFMNSHYHITKTKHWQS